jgi:hypothetical protein
MHMIFQVVEGEWVIQSSLTNCLHIFYCSWAFSSCVLSNLHLYIDVFPPLLDYVTFLFMMIDSDKLNILHLQLQAW